MPFPANPVSLPVASADLPQTAAALWLSSVVRRRFWNVIFTGHGASVLCLEGSCRGFSCCPAPPHTFCSVFSLSWPPIMSMCIQDAPIKRPGFGITKGAKRGNAES